MIFIVTLLIFLSSTLQFSTPMQGPIVATTPAHQNEIVLYDIGTDTIRRLSFGSGYINVWGFSPSGCEILFTQIESNGLAQLYISDLNGENVRNPITYDELPISQWGVWEPAWSPDGSKIAFKMLRDGFEGEIERQYHIGWIPAEGGTPEFYSVTGREHTPQWSPDSQWLAYISYDERIAGQDIYSTAEPTREPAPGENIPPATFLNEADIWIVSADGQAKYRHTSFPVGSVSKPVWSPDGDLLSFVYSPSPNNDTFWIIGSEQGSLPTQLSFNWSLILDHTWLPDSTGIIAAVRDFREIAENKLWFIPLIGNADEEAFLYLDQKQFQSVDYPRFSANGAYLALRSAYNFFVVNTQDNNVLLFSEELRGNTPPVWSPANFSGEIDCSL